MEELIVQYYYDENPVFKVLYRSENGTQETERFPFTFNVSKENKNQIQWYLEEYLLYPYGAYNDRARNTEEIISNLGEELFKIIFRNEEDQRQEAIRLYNMAMRNPTNCIINISADNTVGWSLPWEFMRDPAFGYLAQKTGGFVRSQPGIVTPVRHITTEISKINILMVISRPGGENDVPFQSIARPLLEIFRPHRNRIHVDVLRPPTFEQLQKVLSEKPNFYHILHFDGHGSFSGSIDNSSSFLSEEGFQGHLVFEKSDGGTRFVSGAELGELLIGYGISVVMLNACQSGMTDPDALYPSVGGELIKTGALGVVAMAYSVYVYTAVQFMSNVYESLINGQTLARAVTMAREALRVQCARESPVGPISLQDWVVPVLFQSGIVQLFEPPESKLHLDIGIIENNQMEAGTEIGLPDQPDHGFIGRDADIWKLEEAFERDTIVLLQAMAGVGKTAIATGFARWWTETGALNGPIFFFSFESYTPIIHVCNQIGNVFDEQIKEQGIEWHLLDAKQRCQIALNILRQIPCLMIWDNFEPVAGFPNGTESLWKKEEQQELKNFLRDLDGGATKIIITSRRDEKWLGMIYRKIALYGLNHWDSLELAEKVLNRAGIDRQNLKPYTELLKYLQGNPLSIQVILPELAFIEPNELLTALQEGSANLSQDDGMQGREHSLTSSLKYRLDSLDESLYQRIGLLGMFQGFVNTDILTFICDNNSAPELIQGLDSNAWREMLDQITDVGLLRKIAINAYNIHPALPWFFHKILNKTYFEEIKWLEKRFVEAYGQLSIIFQNEFYKNNKIIMANMELEEQNFKYAVKIGCKYQMFDSLESIISGIAIKFGRQNRWLELELLVQDIESIATNNLEMPLDGAESLCAALWHDKGLIYEHILQFEKAKKWYIKGLTIAEQLNMEMIQAIILHQLGMTAHKTRDFNEAEKYYEKSLAIARKLNDIHGESLTLNQLGMIAQERGHFDEAEGWYNKSLAIKKDLNDEHGQSTTLHQLGMIAHQKRELNEAEKYYKSSLAIAEELNNENKLSTTLNQLGLVAQERGHFDEAERYYKRSLEIDGKLNDRYGESITLHHLGVIAQERGHFDEAEGWYNKSLAIKKDLKVEYEQASTLYQLGMIAHQKRELDEAEKYYKSSLAIAEKFNNESGQAVALLQLGKLSEDKMQFYEAKTFYLHTEKIYKKINNEQNLTIVHNSLKRLEKKFE